MQIKHLLLSFMFLAFSVALTAQSSSEQKTVLSVYDDVRHKENHLVKLKPNDVFRTHADLIFLDADAMVTYYLPSNQNTYYIDKDGTITPATVSDGGRIIIQEFIDGKRKRVPRKHLKPQATTNDN